jgi:endogenous inhibitor of DNA gyrase (YacG/DUF329 family)
MTSIVPEVNERKCLWCGKFLEASRGRPRKFCSDAHRKRFERQEPRHRRFCPICGNELDESKRADAIYDKAECRIEAHRRRGN